MGFWATLILIGSLTGATGREPSNLPILVNDLDIVKQLPTPPRIEESPAMDGKRFPRLWFGSVRWERPLNPITMGVSADLSPTSVQRYTFQVLPQLRTPDNQIRDLPEGFYIMRMAILRPTDPGEDDELAKLEKEFPRSTLYARYVAGTERIVQVTQGSIRATVEFHFHTISATTLANTLLIQILPIKPESLKRAANGLVLPNSPYELEPSPDYENNVISVPFIPRFSSNLATPQTPVVTTDVREEENLQLGPFIRYAEDFILRTTRKRVEISPRETATALKLRYLSLDSPEILPPLANALRVFKQVGGISDDHTETICRLLAVNATLDDRLFGGIPKPQRLKYAQQLRQSMINKCRIRPEESLTLVRQVHAHEIDPTRTRQLGGAPSRLNLAMNFATNRQQSQDTFSSVQQGFSPIDIKGMLRLGYTYTVNESNSRSKLEGTLVSGGADIDIHYWDMSMSLERYTECTIVQAKKNKETWSFAPYVQGFYICDRETRAPLALTERYYHIFPTVPSSPTLDLFDPKNQIVNLVLRSQHEYFMFLKSIRGYIKPNQNEKENPATVLKGASLAYLDAPSIKPFTLSYPVSFIGEGTKRRLEAKENPGFFERFFHNYSEDF